MITAPLFYAVALPAVLIDGVSKGGFGGGLGVVAVPLMAMVVSPVEAAAIMLPMLCAMDLFNLWVYRGGWDRREARLIIVSALFGIAIGTATFHWLNEEAVRLVLGLIAVLFTLKWILGQLLSTPSEPAPHDSAKGGFWGVITGFTTFVAHAGGPPVSVYLLPRRLEKTTYQATTVLIFGTLNFVKVVPYAWLGQFSVTNLATSAVLIPVGLVGAGIGAWAHSRVPERWFFIAMYILLGLLGIKLIWSGINGLI